jgi:hypothetical protein
MDSAYLAADNGTMILKLRWVASIRAIVVLDSGIGMNCTSVSSAMIVYVCGRKIKITAANLLSLFISRLEEISRPLNCTCANQVAIDQQCIQRTLPWTSSGRKGLILCWFWNEAGAGVSGASGCC